MVTLSEMVEGVRAHAWDYSVEDLSEFELARMIEASGAQSIGEAIDVIRCELALRADPSTHC